MEWEQLLSTERLGRGQEQKTDARSEYQRDYDRIVFSSAFRRLQDKTQVFPLAESDYVRTRLTHSVEVSCVGRSLGTLAGSLIIERSGLKGFQAQEFGNIVAAACLAHDIGNPPFGHSGEDAIRTWFEGPGKSYLKDLDPEQIQDFLKFEGNAQGFRVLSRLQNKINGGGLQLTYAVLGAYSKYPRRAHILSLEGSEKVSEKKFGYVIGDEEWFVKVAEGLGLKKKLDGAWSRHPLAFLMEAADDICYRIVDLEDGHRLGRVTFSDAKQLLEPIAFGSEGIPVSGSYADIDNNKGRFEYLRAIAINSLILDAVSVFEKNYEKLMQGTHERDLMSQSKFINELRAIKKLSREKVYAAPSVLHIEAAGFEVLGRLLDKVVPALVGTEDSRSAAEKKILEIIPEQFRKGKTHYERLLHATDFVSGMTDSFAVTLYRRLQGIELPRG
ncbi:deoxyguanosinetriphosphate triphosphohydrolase [Nitrosomonas sp.]|uniref:deoxyguanosinetriphosphate triphosphohydrolase n=1 Tax=Nitrosomonas sp. TaxID=42353 RepID=UPI002607EC86|nr:deoxyguanosinetriphosphate triphosphohydrolase [Nitrosomonas sp.]MCW5602386.1 deoxyguanosinetriphosphate triphosphohydrolase [Nitrosomonas sp.]